MENNLFEFSSEQLEKKANKEILKLSEDKSSVAEPSAYILGGQPGAGKTALQKIIMEQCKDNVIIINGDEFRKKHPNFDKIQKEYGKDASIHTQKFSGKMTENIIDKLSDDNYNLIIEGTLRTSEVPLDTQKKLADKGYKTELSVIAVKPEISYLGTISRYEDMYVAGQDPRATPKEHHDKVVEAIPNNLDVIYESNKFDNITIYDRSGECLYNQKDTPEIKPKDIISKTFNREWTTKEIENLNKDIGKITKHMEDRNAPELEEFKQNANEIRNKAMNVENTKSLSIDPKESTEINYTNAYKIKGMEINFDYSKNDFDSNFLISAKGEYNHKLEITKCDDYSVCWNCEKNGENLINVNNGIEVKNIIDFENKVISNGYISEELLDMKMLKELRIIEIEIKNKEIELEKESRKNEKTEIIKPEKAVKSKDDDFNKQYLEKQRRKSLAKEKQKDLGMER